MKHNNIIKLCLGIFLAFTMALPAIAQKTQTFKGVVVDTTGEPIIGASVKVVGTTTGTITDLDGKFMVVVPSGKQVEISYIGYITQVLSDFKQTKIELKEDTQQLVFNKSSSCKKGPTNAGSSSVANGLPLDRKSVV